jgi:hypothetical protein
VNEKREKKISFTPNFNLSQRNNQKALRSILAIKRIKIATCNV